ncbi:MAG: lipopolysaccharide heptosyltransferase II [Elusimicrobiota bacterium]|nr:lipopolysaccharide heptosyltransferase II [Elusimicrobiota bacterium]
MKILIIRVSSIGDIVLATPLVRCLRTAVPSAQIDFLVKKKYSEILSANPYISNLIFFENNIVEPAQRIKKEKYDFILDIHNNFRTFLLTLFSGAKILRYKNYMFRRFFLAEFGLNFYKEREKIPVFQRYLKTAESFGIFDDDKGLDFFIDKNVENKVEQILKNQYIGICPVAVWKTKRWPKENFIEVAKRILEKNNYEVLVFGGKNDFDYCENIKIQIGPKAKNLCGLSLQETAVAIRKCKHLLTNDTGLMHIAEALKVPVVAFFGPTVEEFGFYPQSEKSKFFSKDIFCRPCSTKGSKKCPVGDFRCMTEISVEEVFSHCAACL